MPIQSASPAHLKHELWYEQAWCVRKSFASFASYVRKFCASSFADGVLLKML